MVNVDKTNDLKKSEKNKKYKRYNNYYPFNTSFITFYKFTG